MYQTILLAILFLIVIYLLYQNYSIQREIYKIKNSFDELNNFLDLSIKKSKPKVLDTLSSINTTDITDNVITYSNDVRRVKVETTINSDENKKIINQKINTKNNDDLIIENIQNNIDYGDEINNENNKEDQNDEEGDEKEDEDEKKNKEGNKTNFIQNTVKFLFS